MDLVTWIRAEWDRALAVMALLAGAVLVGVGYLGVANSPFVAEQLAYVVSGGIGGLLCFGLGIGLLLSADMHDEWRKLDRLETLIRETVPAAPTDVRTAASLTEISGQRVAPSGAPSNGRDAGVVMASVVTEDGRSAWDRNGITMAGTLAVAVTVLVGWNHAAGSAGMAEALPGVWTAAAALAVGGIGLALNVGMRRARIVRRTRHLVGAVVPAGDSRSPGEAALPADADDRVLVVEGLTYFHRPGCPTMVSATAQHVDAAAARVRHAPCPLCDAEALG